MARQVAGLDIREVSLDDVVPNGWNPNVQNAKVAKAERESIETFGFIDPVLVRPHPTHEGKFQIVDGEHRWKTLRDLGRTSVPVIVRDLTDEQAKKLTVMMNEIGGDPDQLLLAQLLDDISGMDDFAVGLPYSEKELAKMLAFAQEPEPDTGGSDDGGGAAADDESVEKEVVLVYGNKRHDDFQNWVGIVARDYGMKAVSDVVLEAVRREALRVNQGTRE